MPALVSAGKRGVWDSESGGMQCRRRGLQGHFSQVSEAQVGQEGGLCKAQVSWPTHLRTAL